MMCCSGMRVMQAPAKILVARTPVRRPLKMTSLIRLMRLLQVRITPQLPTGNLQTSVFGQRLMTWRKISNPYAQHQPDTHLHPNSHLVLNQKQQSIVKTAQVPPSCSPAALPARPELHRPFIDILRQHQRPASPSPKAHLLASTTSLVGPSTSF